MFARIRRRLGEDGRIAPVIDHPEALPAAGQLNIEIAVIQQVENDPDVSTRPLATQFGVSQSTIWRINNNAGYYPHPRLVCR